MRKLCNFHATSFHRLVILSTHLLVSLPSCIPYILTAVTLIILSIITRVRIMNRFLEIIIHTFCFLFLLLNDWRTSENLPTETSRYP